MTTFHLEVTAFGGRKLVVRPSGDLQFSMRGGVLLAQTGGRVVIPQTFCRMVAKALCEYLIEKLQKDRWGKSVPNQAIVSCYKPAVCLLGAVAKFAVMHSMGLEHLGLGGTVWPSLSAVGGTEGSPAEMRWL